MCTVDRNAPIRQPSRERGDARGRGADLGGVVVGEQQHAHEQQSGDGEREGDFLREEGLAARVFQGYARDPRKRRAWSADNLGNVAMREEVRRQLFELAGGWLHGGEESVHRGAEEVRDGSEEVLDGAEEVRDGAGLVLDAGCGTGWWLQTLAHEGVASERLVGVDLLAERVRAARERVPRARFVQGDVRELALEDGSCALVTAVHRVIRYGRARGCRAGPGGGSPRVRPGGGVAVWEPRVWSPTRTRVWSASASCARGLAGTTAMSRS